MGKLDGLSVGLAVVTFVGAVAPPPGVSEGAVGKLDGLSVGRAVGPFFGAVGTPL
jgi:hypothetical protein